MNEDYIIILITAIAGFLSSLLGMLYLPVMLLVACNIIDYATGLMAAKKRNEKVNSYKSLNGIYKKVCMYLLVGIGSILDFLIAYSAETYGFTFPFTFIVANVVVIWLLCHEIISILENMIDIGMDIPAFMQKIVKKIKSQVEGMAGENEELTNKDEEED